MRDPEAPRRPRGRRSSRRLTRGRKLLYAVAIPLGIFLIRLFWISCRVRLLQAQDLDARLARHDPSILCYWHRHQLFCWWYVRTRLKRGARIAWLISASVDGEVPTGIAKAIGGGVVFRGSTTSGGAEALRGMYKGIRRDGFSIASTPDGPSGPAEVFKPGIVKLAQLSGAPLVPMSWHARRAWVFRTWDRFVLPKPFTRVTIAVGTPLYIPREADDAAVEALRLAAQRALSDLHQRAHAADS